MFSPGYGDPTTKSTANEFKDFLGKIGYTIDQVVGTHAQAHRSFHMEYRRNGYGRMSSECPDDEGLSIGMSVVFTMLWAAAEEITEAEQRLEYVTEEDSGSEEYQHALGELFAAKTVFIAMYKRIPILEKDRIRATEQGRNQKHFLRSVIDGQGSDQGLPEPKFKMGVASASINLAYNPPIFNSNKINIADFRI